MGKIKTIGDYVNKIIELHNQDRTAENHKKLKYNLGKWASLLNIRVRAAQNEQSPWTEKEIGYKILPMLLKKETGYNQVGDYIFEILIEGVSQIIGTVVIERKTIQDWYGTLMNGRQRKRFYAELDRFEVDPRFSKMVVMIEGSMDEFIEFIPKIFVCGWGSIPGQGERKLAEYLQKYYLIKDVKPNQIYKLESDKQIIAITTTNSILIQLEAGGRAGLYVDGVRKDTLVAERKYSRLSLYQCKGASVESRMGTMARFVVRDVQPVWCGSRKRATELYKYIIRQSCIKDYRRILGLEKYNE